MGEDVQGKVKWFSEQKGQGYIVADNGVEHFVHIRDLQGTDLPRNGDLVKFESVKGPKGPRATSVSVLSRSQNHSGGRGTDERVTCEGCSKKIVPRIISHHGKPSKSVCPYCGTIYKDFGACFIATTVYGDYDAPEVVTLRRFRDEKLRPYSLGRKFIALYYRYSPPVAQYVSQRPALSRIIKKLLDILIH